MDAPGVNKHSFDYSGTIRIFLVPVVTDLFRILDISKLYFKDRKYESNFLFIDNNILFHMFCSM